MPEGSNRRSIEMRGRWSYRLSNLAHLLWISLYVYLRRLDKGPLRPGWNWTVETGTEFAKTQLRIGFRKRDVREAREYEDALVIMDPASSRVGLQAVADPIRGAWFVPPQGNPDRFILYLHGGGYAYYSRAHCSMAAILAEAAGARMFALDYRLAPEHPFPAQLEDAVGAYRWLTQGGIDPGQLVVIGDSAGGNLTLALLLYLRDAGLPQPGLAICISPWTDLRNSGESMTRNEKFDFIDRQMVERWAAWFLHGADPRNPLISPLYADLTSLAPIYVQAGGAGVLHDMVRAFAERAKQQGADVMLDVWPTMNHEFQAFGQSSAESREALESIREMIEKRMR